MKISIVIPAYNAATFLTKTLETVVSQTFTDWELIIVDDGSSDQTFAVASEWSNKDSRIKAVRKENGGVATARNFGIQKADPSSEYLILLDHDDLWEPVALVSLLSALDNDPDAVAAHGLAKKSSASSNPGDILGNDRRKLIMTAGSVRVVSCHESEPTTFEVMAYDGCLCTPGMALIRRSAIEGMCLFQQSLAPSDDFDFWVRLSLRGYFAYVNKIVIEWRQHETNVSRQGTLMADALARNRNHILRLPELNPEQRRLAFWRYSRMYASIIRHNAIDYQGWAMESLRRGRPADAVRYQGAAFACYRQYLWLRLFWKEGEDRGPLPARLKEDREQAQAKAIQ